jgi:hypothetical protein
MLKSKPHQKKIVKIFNEWKISFIYNKDSINIVIQQNNSNNIYESSFKLEKFQSLKLFISKNSIKEILDLIISLISHNEIQIEEKKKHIKINIKINFRKHSK